MTETEQPLDPLEKAKLARDALVKANNEVTLFKSEDPQLALQLGYTLVVRRFLHVFGIHESRKASLRQAFKGKFEDEEEAINQVMELDDVNRTMNEIKSSLLDVIQSAQEGKYQPLRIYIATEGVKLINNNLKLGQGMLRVVAVMPVSGEPLDYIPHPLTQSS